MSTPIDFYFDLSSPYGYLAATRIDEIGARHGREVRWHPYLMGAAMKITGSVPLVDRRMINEYSLHDMQRSARLLGVRFAMPEPFPVSTVAACRACYWVEANAGVQAAKALASALYAGYFADGRNIGDPDTVLAIAAECGHQRDAVAAGTQDPAIKARLKTETEGAIERGAFGSPFVFVDDQPFWGHDRLDHVDLWLERGGW